MKRLSAVTLIITLIYSSVAQANNELSDIRALLLSLLARVERLETENQQLRNEVRLTSTNVKAVQASAQPERKNRWADTVSISGDLRARYESFDIDGRDDRERS